MNRAGAPCSRLEGHERVDRGVRHPAVIARSGPCRARENRTSSEEPAQADRGCSPSAGDELQVEHEVDVLTDDERAAFVARAPRDAEVVTVDAALRAVAEATTAL